MFGQLEFCHLPPYEMFVPLFGVAQYLSRIESIPGFVSWHMPSMFLLLQNGPICKLTFWGGRWKFVNILYFYLES